jgi:hypothetical protein
MRNFFMGMILALFASPVMSQQSCYSFEYQQQVMRNNPGLTAAVQQVEQFILAQQGSSPVLQTTSRGKPLIIIPVVVHVVYNKAGENVSDQAIASMINTLNLCYRREHPDTIKTPERFMSVAADCEIEFQLATSDPQRRATNGIVRKYTPVSLWDIDDKVKFANQSGDNAWDAKSYLNIWICNLRWASGYSSLPGDEAAKDGVVLGYTSLGKTVVHEVGHWLGLKHIWGDQYCGDDGIADTPQQAVATAGCPSGIRISCSNGPNGDMYMNYMDVTGDACTNLFTNGQKMRMQTLFKSGGLRYSLFASTGLKEPTNQEIPLPIDTTTTTPVPVVLQQPTLFPNPASNEITLDLANDLQWVGKIVYISNAQGLIVMQQQVNAKVQRIDVSRLRAGMYFINGKREDGVMIKQKFLKL